MNNPPIKLYCSLVIEKDGKLLLIKEAKPKVYGKWNQPAGHLDGTETPFECAIREAKEETGYDVELTGLQAIYYLPTESEYGINFCFRAEPKNDLQSKLADDVLETKWFSKEELRQLPKENFRHALAIKRMKDWLLNKKFSIKILDKYPENHRE